MAILLLSDKKDDASRIQHKDFADGNGKLFWFLLYKAGINLRDVQIKYVESGVPKLDKYDIVVPLGQEALDAVYSGGKIKTLRGSVLGEGNPWIIPTLNPRVLKKPFEVFREASVESAQLVMFDLQKVKRIYENGFTKPVEHFTLEPTIEELEQFVRESLEAPYLGVDIEGTGLNLDYTDIVTIGFATSRERAFIVPLRTTGGASYWPLRHAKRVAEALDELLLKRKLLFQNGYGYDIPLLRRDGWYIPWENYISDTMLLHHALDPELPHNIGFISSVWGHQPYWKDSFLARKEHIYDTDQVEMRRYNARDCTALIDIHEAMIPEVEKLGTMHIFEKEMAQCAPIVIMKERGIGKDLKKLASWQVWLTAELEKANEAVRIDLDLPEAFNFNSQDHKNWLLYGFATSGLQKKAEALKEYDKEIESVQYECISCSSKRSFKFEAGKWPSTLEAKCSKCRQNMPFQRTGKSTTPTKAKRRDTAIYKKYLDAAKILAVDHITKPKSFRPSKTDSGKYGAGVEDISRFLNAVHKRQEQLDGLKKPTEKHRLEADDLQKSSDFLERFGELAKLLKLKSSFYDLPTGTDGRVHPAILIQGTATGRYACVNPNAQQMPNSKSVAGGKVRDLFRAISDEYVLISSDYSNLEVNVGAPFMEDQVLIGQLRMGLDIHDENTKTFFKTDSSDDRWSVLRSISKIIQFGRLFYGGSNRGIYSKVRTKEPNSGLTFKNFVIAVEHYFEDHPGFARFVESVQALARDKRISVNGYGRVRRLYDNLQSIPRQALNNPIQGTAADFVGDVIIRLWNRGIGNKYKSYMCLQVHDEILTMVYKKELKEVGRIIHEEMTRAQIIKTYTGKEVSVTVPVNHEIGRNWGTMDGYDILTGEITEGTTH